MQNKDTEVCYFNTLWGEKKNFFKSFLDKSDCNMKFHKTWTDIPNDQT